MTSKESVPEQKTNWKKSWNEGKIGFHLSQANPSLVQYADLLHNAHSILIPLCGKTLDMHFLRQKGHQILGIELVSQAIVDFFEEWNVQPQKKENRSTHEGITLIESNIFAIQKNDLPLIDGIFDRAALVALPTHIRSQYANHLLSILNDKGRILLISYDMPRSQEIGPPFTVRKEDIPALFHSASSVTLLKEIHNTAEEEPRLILRGMEWSKEHIWLIEK
jgi:thiopurine S-methyltransferase